MTPAAFTACRSIGASSQGFFGSRVCSGVLARMAREIADAVRMRAARPPAAGSGDSQRSRMVGNEREMSNTPSWRIATTDGPASSGRHTRPTSVPEVESEGRVDVGIECECHGGLS